MTDRLYAICSSLEWRLGCYMSEWKAARMGKAGHELNRGHYLSVLKLLTEDITMLSEING